MFRFWLGLGLRSYHCTSNFLPSSSLFFNCFHHDSCSTFNLIDTHLLKPNPKCPVVNPCSNKAPFKFTPSLWYSSKSGFRSSRAYRKRVNRRLRLANKPVLDQARFDEVVSQLPARFTPDDLHNVMVPESDALVCLELFNWGSKNPRFKHSVNTYHITIQKLGIAGMLEEMYNIVDQLLAVPDFGSEPLFNTIIYYYTHARQLSRAITVFKHMKKMKNRELRPSIRTYNLLFAALLSRRTDTHINHMYMGTMECLFRQMLSDGIGPDIFSINLMIQGYVLSNHVNDGLRMFHQMGVVYSCKPDAVTYDQLIHGLCAQARTNNARELFNKMKEKGFVVSAKTYNSLVNALALGGEVDEALIYLWEMMAKQRAADFITYRTLLGEFCRKGRAGEALSLLKEFKEKCLVDGPTYRRLLDVLENDYCNARIRSCTKLRSCLP